MREIKLVPYDAHWPVIFEMERKMISATLWNNCVAIYHIGSTAIPGLSAKPIIDIIAIAKDRRNAVERLEQTGYTYRGEWNIPLKCGFVKRGITSVNLHVFFDKDHPEIELNLKFRDYLRNHSDVRNEYAAVKMKILESEDANRRSEGTLFKIYTLKKREFIDGIMKSAGVTRPRILKCVTENEWNAAKNFRKKYFERLNMTDSISGNFDASNHEHFILYRGVEIVGYADILTNPESRAKLQIFENLDNEATQYFRNTINEWIELRY